MEEETNYSLRESLEEALKEVQLIEAGKLKKRNAREFLAELRKEIEEENI